MDTYNVKVYGAKGDRVADDTAAIQHAIDDLTTCRRGILYFPSGIYRITSPLIFNGPDEEFGGLNGIVIAGAGSLVRVTETHLEEFAGSLIEADTEGSGFDDDPMVNFFGINNVHFHDISFSGNNFAVVHGAAKFGIRVQGNTGRGGGYFLFENCTFHYCAECVNFGHPITPTSEDPGPANCDLSTFVHCNFHDSTVGVRTNHTQALGHSFYGCNFLTVADCFQLNAGTVTAVGCSTYNATRVVVIETGGVNLGPVTFVNLRMDGPTARTVVYDSTGIASEVMHEATFIDTMGLANSVSGDARFKLMRCANVKIIGGHGLCGADGVLFDLDGSGGTNGPVIHVQDAYISGTQAQVVGAVSGSAEYQIRGCVDQSTFRTIPDYGKAPSALRLVRDVLLDLEDLTSPAWTSSATGGGTISQVFGTNDRIGVHELSTGASTGHASLRIWPDVYLFGAGEMVFEASFNLSSVSSSSDLYGFSIGFSDQTTSALLGGATDGAFLYYSNAGSNPNWRRVTSNNGTQTATDSSVAMSTGWHTVRIVVDETASSAEFFLDNVSLSVNTTNIPTSSTRTFGLFAGITKGTGTTPITLRLDWVSVRKTFTASR